MSVVRRYCQSAVEVGQRFFRTLVELNRAWVNRGNALRYLDRAEEAIASFDQAIELDSDLAEAHWNKSLLCLSIGDFARGWPGYEWRWRREGELQPREFTQPQWRGETLTGKTILLQAN